MTRDAVLGCSLPGVDHWLPPRINHRGVRPFVGAAEPYLPPPAPAPPSLHEVSLHTFPGPRPRVDKWVTVRTEAGERRGVGGRETAGVEHRAMHMKNKPLSDPNCSPRVSHSWANLYVPAPPGSRSAGETGNDGPPVARPRWGAADHSTRQKTRQKASRRTAYVWLMEANCSPLKETSATKNTSEATFSAQWQRRRKKKENKSSQVKEMKGRRAGDWMLSDGAGPHWQGSATANSIYGAALNGKGSAVFYWLGQDNYTNSCFLPWLALCAGDTFTRRQHA